MAQLSGGYSACLWERMPERQRVGMKGELWGSAMLSYLQVGFDLLDVVRALAQGPAQGQPVHVCVGMLCLWWGALTTTACLVARKCMGDGLELTRVDGQGGKAERLRHDDGGGLMTHPGQGLEVVKGGGHLPAEPLANLWAIKGREVRLCD